jgi:hypothetical protein
MEECAALLLVIVVTFVTALELADILGSVVRFLQL